MADIKTNREERKEGTGALAQRERDPRAVQRWDPWSSSLDWMDRFGDEMERTFDRVFRDFGFPRRSRVARGFFDTPIRSGIWSPRVEAFQKGNRFIVRADLPGLKKDDVHVEVTGEALTIHGESREEHKEEREGYYHSERQYGQFHRTIPLPEGVISDSAQASFRNGVLEITMQAAPAEANQGRRIEIKDVPESESKR